MNAYSLPCSSDLLHPRTRVHPGRLSNLSGFSDRVYRIHMYIKETISRWTPQHPERGLHAGRITLLCGATGLVVFVIFFRQAALYLTVSLQNKDKPQKTDPPPRLNNAIGGTHSPVQTPFSESAIPVMQAVDDLLMTFRMQIITYFGGRCAS
jgi:hypothetical protein